jgi:uncharacterized membrane protein YhfC
MGVSAVVSVGLPVVLFIALRKKHGLKVVPMLAGAAAFLVFAMILEQLLHVLVLRPSPDGTIGLKSNPLLYMLYGCSAAGIFEESARFLSFSLLKKKYSGIGTGLSYGIGHGGFESAVLVGASLVSSVVLCVMFNAGIIENLGLPANVIEQVAAVKDMNPFLLLAGGFERICAMAIQISLSLIVWRSVAGRDKRWLFPVAILLHAAADAPAALMQAGALSGIPLVEGIIAAEAVALAAIAVLVCKKFKMDDTVKNLRSYPCE